MQQQKVRTTTLPVTGSCESQEPQQQLLKKRSFIHRRKKWACVELPPREKGALVVRGQKQAFVVWEADAVVAKKRAAPAMSSTACEFVHNWMELAAQEKRQRGGQPPWGKRRFMCTCRLLIDLTV